jgi:hypothetical protein
MGLDSEPNEKRMKLMMCFQDMDLRFPSCTVKGETDF